MPSNKKVKGSEQVNQVTTQPDNSGIALAGTLLSAALAPATGGLSLMAAPAFANGATALPGGAAPTNPAYQTSSNPFSLPWLT